MHLLMAIGVQEDTIGHPIRSPMTAPPEMMGMPSRQVRNRLTTDRTAALLLLPQIQQLSTTLQVVRHSHAEALFKVDFPSWIIRVCRPFDLRMSFDQHLSSGEQLYPLSPSMFSCSFSTEHPVSIPDDLEVLVLDPSARFVRVPAFGPLPQGPEERVIHFGKGLLTGHVPVIVGPPPDQGVEEPNQISRCCLRVGPNECSAFANKEWTLLREGVTRIVP